MRFLADFAVNIREVRQYGNSVIVMTLHSAYDTINSYDREGKEVGGQLSPPVGHCAEGYAVNNIIVGSPDTVIKKLTEIIAHLNPGYLHIYGNPYAA